MPVDPSSLKLRNYPDPVLRQRATPLPGVNAEVRAVADAMLKIMRGKEGIGLAAPQVGLAWRMFIVDVPPSDTRSADADPASATHGPVAYINPVLSRPQGTIELYEEGCLSLPDIRGDVLRPPTMTITALDLDGQEFTQTATGLLARCWQHEFDHLNGVLIIDKMTAPFRLKNKAAIRDLERGVD